MNVTRYQSGWVAHLRYLTISRLSGEVVIWLAIAGRKPLAHLPRWRRRLFHLPSVRVRLWPRPFRKHVRKPA